jgi:hypothetical protein
MTDAPQNLSMEYIPTLSERFWRKLGYRFHLGDEPEGVDTLPGWTCTEIGLNFGMADRLRLMLTGKLRLRSILMTDTPSATICKNRLDWRIIPPKGFDRC